MQHEFRVLVADDNPTVQGFVRELLRRRGYEMDLAEDGQEAVEKFREKTYDLVILDIGMPRMDGMQALRHIRARDAHVGVIIMTGYWADREEVEAEKLGAAFLNKPFSLDAFWSLVDQLAENHALWRAEHPSSDDRSETETALPRDRRRHLRAAVELPTALMVLQPHEIEGRSCEILDISLGGSRNQFTLDSPYPAGAAVRLVFTSVQSEGLVALEATVAWTDFTSRRCGAEFYNTDERQKLALEKVLVHAWRSGDS